MQTHAAPTPRRVAVASAVGATIEWYDFFLYGTAAGLVFDKLYFNGLHGPAAQFAAFGTFAVGFLARRSAACCSGTSATAWAASRCCCSRC